jgi:hypothetical protein
VAARQLAPDRQGDSDVRYRKESSITRTFLSPRDYIIALIKKIPRPLSSTIDEKVEDEQLHVNAGLISFGRLKKM